MPDDESKAGKKGPFIPASARRVIARAGGVPIDKAVRDIVAGAAVDDVAEKRDGKQGALDGTPDLAVGLQLERVRPRITLDQEDDKKDTTEKSTDKQTKEDKEGKEAKEAKEGKDGKEAKDVDEGAKFGSSEVEIGMGVVVYGPIEAIDVAKLDAAVSAHAKRGLLKGPIA